MTARTPRIVQIVPVIADEASGPSYSVARLCESLIQQGQDVTLAALDWTAAPVPRSYLRTFPLGFGPRRLGRSPRMREWLLREAQEGSFDIMHNHSLWMMPNVYPGQVAKQVNIPYVVSPRGTLSAWAMANGSRVKRLFWPTVQRPSLAATTCFHITAKSECADIRRFGFRQPVCVIPNGVDIRPLLAKADHNHRTLLFLGRIHPIKGVDILLRAWGAVMQRYPDWCLRIVGPDNDGYLPRMKRLATGLAVERVTFSGPLYGDAKWRAYADAELFVLPTHTENFGMSVAESLASGTPAIVTHGAPWSGLDDRYAGWWIEPGCDSLVACLESVLGRSKEDLTEMGLSGRAWMQTDFSWTEVGRRMAETYRWILQSTNKPSWVIE